LRHQVGDAARWPGKFMIENWRESRLEVDYGSEGFPAYRDSASVTAKLLHGGDLARSAKTAERFAAQREARSIRFRRNTGPESLPNVCGFDYHARALPGTLNTQRLDRRSGVASTKAFHVRSWRRLVCVGPSFLGHQRGKLSARTEVKN